jgi:hypothetical protein
LGLVTFALRGETGLLFRKSSKMATGRIHKVDETRSRHTITVELKVRDIFITLNIDMNLSYKMIPAELCVDENLFGYGSILTS